MTSTAYTTWNSPNGPVSSHEPAGLTYDSATNGLLVADDNTKTIYLVGPGADQKPGTSDDELSGNFPVRVPHLPPSAVDPESIALDASTDDFFIADAVNSEIYRFTRSGDFLSSFDVGAFGAQSPEGLTYYESRDTLLLLDDGKKLLGLPCRVYEISKDGRLLNVVNIDAGKCGHAAGITLAPASGGGGKMSMYIVDRGKDNDTNPPLISNDGLLEELSVDLPPGVNAGPDTAVEQLTAPSITTVTLAGLVMPKGVTATWSQLSGPSVGSIPSSTLAPNVVLPKAGTYVFKLTATAAGVTNSDTVTVVSSGLPNAVLTATPNIGSAPLNVTLDASGSSDSDGIADFTFDFKDGSAPVVQKDPKIDHMYMTGGIFAAQVTVTDKLGVKSTASTTIVVNAVPTVSAGPDRSVVMPAPASLAGSASDDGRPNPPGTLTASWSTVSGPGTVTFAAAGAPSTTATFSAPGTYVLRLTATDSAASATDDVTVTVQAAAPPPPAQVPPVSVPVAPTVTVHAVTPQRILDTRSGLGAKQRKLRPGRALTLQVEGRGGFPSAGVDAVMLNITVLRPKARGSLTVWPSKLLRPSTKSLAFKRGVTKSKLIKTVVGSNGKIRIYNRSARPIHLRASTNAWWGT